MDEVLGLSSGGSQKEEHCVIFIEAPQKDAIKIFFAIYGHNPERVTCTCCGQDYSISESEHMDTKYHEGRDTIRIIPKDEFPTGWADVEVPEQGYVWKD